MLETAGSWLELCLLVVAPGLKKVLMSGCVYLASDTFFLEDLEDSLLLDLTVCLLPPDTLATLDIGKNCAYLPVPLVKVEPRIFTSSGGKSGSCKFRRHIPGPGRKFSA